MKYFYFIFLSSILSSMTAQVNKRGINQHWKTDKTKSTVDLDEFKVLLVRDGIPPIDQPKFWNHQESERHYFKHEPVIAVEINGEVKAYPLSILMYHEIVNDELGGMKIFVTYCPLCNAAIVFDRKLTFNEKDLLLDFGVSGMLRNSDMVMWDRQTESWWQQFTGEGLVGELAGAQLSLLPSLLISYDEFFSNYPDGKILSTDTGHDKDYGTNPYVNYDNLQSNNPRLFDGAVDSRLPAMERVISINANGYDKIYPLSVIQGRGIIQDRTHDIDVVIFFQKGTVSVMDRANISDSKSVGTVTVFDPNVDGSLLTFEKIREGFEDIETGSEWTITGKCINGSLEGKQLEPIIHGNHFAFAWFAFKPESEIYDEY